MENNQLQILNFNEGGKKLFVFTWDGKITTIAPELMAFEGYLDVTSSWRDNKISQEFEEGVEYITLKGEDLKIFKDILKDSQDLTLVLGENRKTLYEHYKSVPRLDLVFEEGIYGIMYNSGSNHANSFRKWMRRDVNTSIRKTGSFDVIENQLEKLEDDIEKKLKNKVYKLEQLVKLTPDDWMLTNAYNKANQELSNYMSDKKLKQLETKFDELDSKIKKASNLRENDMSAEIIAKKFKIYSLKNKPHVLFADCLAKELGFYISPEGNGGYCDDYISINLSNRGGNIVPVLKYSELAYEEMKEHIENNGLKFDEVVYGKRGVDKGKFKEVYMVFSNKDHIKVNESTYRMYCKI